MESKGLVATLVEQDFGLKWNGGRWARSLEHDSLVIDTEKDLFFWNSENKFGDALDYLIFIRKYSEKQAKEYLKSIHIGISPVAAVEVPYVPYEKLVEILWVNGKSIRDYWYERTLTDNTIDRYRLGFFNGWFTIPLYSNNQFINFQCRRDKPEKRIKLWYKDTHFTPVLFNEDVLKFTNTVFVPEGLVDCILLSQHGIPSVTKASGASYFNPEWVSKFKNIKEIYYIADNDIAGIKGAKKTAQVLGLDKVKIFRFKDKKEKYDTGDYFKEGGNPEEFVKLVKENSVYGFQEGDI
jgi:DNA primase